MSKGKIYRGRRWPAGTLVTVDGHALDPRFDLWSHSPTGFEWGYGGSGPAQLALALLADVLQDDDQALAEYQDFKWEVLAALRGDEWSLTEAEIRQHLHNRWLRLAMEEQVQIGVRSPADPEYVEAWYPPQSRGGPA